MGDKAAAVAKAAITPPGDKAGLGDEAGERRRQRQRRQQLGRQGWETRPQRRRRSRRETKLEKKAAAAAESGDHEGRRYWETRRQRQQRRDHEGQGWETGQQAQKVAIMKGDKAGREGGLSGLTGKIFGDQDLLHRDVRTLIADTLADAIWGIMEIHGCCPSGSDLH